MDSAKKFIVQKLEERKLNGSFRTLKPETTLIDFCSNDYLGFAHSPILKTWTEEEVKNNLNSLNGATGSRLLSGNLTYTEDLEKQIAAYHQFEAGLIYNSGYDANLGLLSSIPQRGDTIIIDELIHASIIDGARLSHANRFTFKHNDLQSLEEKLKHARGICYVAIESVYSMDGDTPPIEQMLLLTEKYNAHLIVDEAHAVGLYSKGIVNQLGLQNRVFAILVTFGKALGCSGAIILGSNLLRQYLINFSRSFIYTTAAPFQHLASVKMAYRLLDQSAVEIEKLEQNILFFKQGLIAGTPYQLLPSNSAIQCIVIGSNEKAKLIANKLQHCGFDIRPILSPTVAKETERIRICLHSFNGNNQLTLLLQNLIKHLNA